MLADVSSISGVSGISSVSSVSSIRGVSSVENLSVSSPTWLMFPKHFLAADLMEQVRVEGSEGAQRARRGGRGYS